MGTRPTDDQDSPCVQHIRTDNSVDITREQAQALRLETIVRGSTGGSTKPPTDRIPPQDDQASALTHDTESAIEGKVVTVTTTDIEGAFHCMLVHRQVTRLREHGAGTTPFHLTLTKQSWVC